MTLKWFGGSELKISSMLSVYRSAQTYEIGIGYILTLLHISLVHLLIFLYISKDGVVNS